MVLFTVVYAYTHPIPLKVSVLICGLSRSLAITTFASTPSSFFCTSEEVDILVCADSVSKSHTEAKNAIAE